MADQGFKTKMFGGFNKKQVLEYIDEIHSGFNEKSAAFQEEINQLNKENEQLAASVEKSYDENQKLQADINQLLEQKNSSLKLLKQKDAEILDHKEKVRRAVFQMESMKAKCSKYDEIHLRINDLISESKNMAKKIVSDARVEANEIIANAKLEACTYNKTADVSHIKVEDGLESVSDDIKLIRSGLSLMTKQVESKLKEIELILDKSKGNESSENSLKDKIETTKSDSFRVSVEPERKAQVKATSDKYYSNRDFF